MSYFGALPSPTAAQRKEGDALMPFSNGQRMILMPRSDGGEPFWAKADDVIAAHKKNPAAVKYMIPRIMAGPESKAGVVTTQSSPGVKAEDVLAVVEKFAPRKSAGPVFSSQGSGLPTGPTAALTPNVDALTGKKEGLPLWVWAAGGAVAVFALLRKR
jgi:hypothetical protein